MTYSVYQPWDPLKVCVVGRGYNENFFNHIKNSKVRNVLDRIARETEEDFQNLINLLKKFNVKVVRPNNIKPFKKNNLCYLFPPISARNSVGIVGKNVFFQDINQLNQTAWDKIKGVDWPNVVPSTLDEFKMLPILIKKEIKNITGIDEKNYTYNNLFDTVWGDIADLVQKENNPIHRWDKLEINTAMITRVGKDLIFGTDANEQSIYNDQSIDYFSNYRKHLYNSKGHIDGCFVPIKPGLILTTPYAPDIGKYFPGWEVIHLNQINESGNDWINFKKNSKNNNHFRWAIPGEESNTDLINFIDSSLGHWIGCSGETYFDANLLTIDENNIVCSNYNKNAFDAFKRHNITPHVINFRHRYFWDDSWHCLTADLHREGTMQDYFPERGKI